MLVLEQIDKHVIKFTPETLDKLQDMGFKLIGGIPEVNHDGLLLNGELKTYSFITITGDITEVTLTNGVFQLVKNEPFAPGFIDFDRLKSISKRDISTSLSEKAMKLSEEAGEVSAEILAYTGSTCASKSAEGDALSVVEECCDTINTAVDIIYNMGLPDSMVAEMFSKKLTKWESKLK